MDVVLDIGQYLIWYFLLAIGIILICLYASYRHKNALPLFWGTTVGAIMIMLHQFLSPIVFGVLEYDYITQFFEWVLTGWFAVVFFAFIGLCCFNLVAYGEVWK